MIGELTEKAHLYENIAKSNGVELSFEVRNTITDILTYEDSKIKSKEQQELLDRLKERDEYKEYISDNCGSFYFNFYNRLEDKIEPQFLTRFLYLCTYLDYESRLVMRKGTRNIPITYGELEEVLILSRREVKTTCDRLIEKELIFMDDAKRIYVNDKYCIKGQIEKNNRIGKARMFNDSIQELYKNSLPREHKKLALLFKMLPYINVNWNVVCKTPLEETMEYIKPFTIKELAFLLEQTNVSRFSKSLLGLTINNENVVMINKTRSGDFITINPKVYYKGNNIDDLKYLINLFKIGSK